MKLYIIKIAVFSTALCLLSSCSSSQKENESAKRKEAKLSTRTLRDAITQMGILEPKRQILLKSELSGTVTKIYVTEGELLKKGQSILGIDPRSYENMREKLLLQRKKAELELSIMQREYDGNAALNKDGGVSERKMEDLKDRLELKTLALSEIDIDLKDVNEKLSKAVLVAPISGTLLSLNTKEGEIVVSATSGYSEGTSIGILASTDSMQVICSVNEADYHSINMKTPASVYLESDPEVKAKGRISFIARSAKAVEGKPVRDFEVKVDVFDLPSTMVPGINVSVEFVLLEKMDALCIPAGFITNGDKNKGTVTVKNTDEKEKEIILVLGATDFKFTEILNGLTKEDIVLEPISKKKEDDK